MKKILVVGSLNMDTVLSSPNIPKPGETIIGRGISHVPGGKGANQAYAIGKLGGNVAMMGAVGDDEFGAALKDNLASVNVDVSGVAALPGVPSGQAYITVEDSGQNCIVVIAGSNFEVSIPFIEERRSQIEEADIIIMQMEIPLETVIYVKDLAEKLGKTVIVDPAPAVAGLPDEFWKGIDYIKPNETELEILAGSPMTTREEIEKGAQLMLDKGVKNVVVSLGGDGIFFKNAEESAFIPTKKVKAVDTTAAGDSFTAGFAISLSKGMAVKDAIAYGQAVSGIVVQRKGAQSSIPTAEELADLI